jgi:hypothetical protein
MNTKFFLFIFFLTAIAFESRAQNANTTLSNLTSPTKVNVDLLPDKDQKRNLGKFTRAWKNLYLDSAIYIDSSRFIAFRTGNGTENTALGRDVLYSNTEGSSNTGVGYKCLYYNKTGNNNIALGRGALFKNIDGDNNGALGYHALYSNTTGYANFGTGTEALENNTTGYSNTAIGPNALQYNKDGYENAATGQSALRSNIHGFYNTATGLYALYFNTTGYNNTALGYNAGENVTNGSNNTFVGYLSNCGSGGHLTNSMALGSNATVTSSNHVVIGDNFITSIGGYAGWSNISDGRVKKNTKQNVPGLAFINKLQPVTYNLDLDAADKIIDKQTLKDKDGKIIQASQTELDARKAKEQIVYTGFIAQDVEKTARSLNFDFSGVDKPDNANTLYGLRYSDFVVPLVKAVQELSKMNDEKDSAINYLQQKYNAQQKEIDELKAMIVLTQSTGNSQLATAFSSTSLSQNIPNPFSNTTTISYSIPQQFSSAKLIVTDKAGNILKQVNLSSGKGSVNMEAATLAQGAYNYSLIVDGKLIATKQMMLAK